MNSKKSVTAYVARRIGKIENHPETPAPLKQLPPRATAKLFSAIGIADASLAFREVRRTR